MTYLSESPTGKRRTFIFFSPHLDDAAISCGGWIAALGQAQKLVRVITVFAAQATPTSQSAYMRHLHADWKLDVTQQRICEDDAALHSLGVRDVERWEFEEAPCRVNAAQQPLYACYDELTGDLVADDHVLIAELTARIASTYEANQRVNILYFPLSIGQHVDHQILFRVGLTLRTRGYSVGFYEDWPYIQNFALVPEPNQAGRRWRAQQMVVQLDQKISAALCYKSQIVVMGGSRKAVVNRLTQSALRGESGATYERFWALTSKAGQRFLTEIERGTATLPFHKLPPRPSADDFRRFLKTFHFNQLEQVLPLGSGLCLDVGCGGGRFCTIVQQRGYRWIGMEYTIALSDKTITPPLLQADCQALPIKNSAVAVVMSWGVMEYILNPEQVIAEAARVLETGGVFCGYMSFLEPTQGASFYGMSGRLLEELLRKYGFKDIHVQAGLNGFAIMLWTWLRRWGGNWAGRFAIPLTVAWMVPLAALRFYSSWLSWRLGRGGGHGMHWIAYDSLNEFAGYVLFSARKPARTEPYAAPVHEPGLFLM